MSQSLIRKISVLFFFLSSVIVHAQGNDTTKVVQNAGIVSPAGTPATTTVTTQVMSPMQLFMKGGWVMIPLLLLLLIAVYFAIERLIVVSKAGKVDRNFMNNIRDYLLNGKIDSARELCRAQSSPVSRVIEKGISRLGKPTKEISDAMEVAGRTEIARVEKNIGMISLVAKVAPMLGFIGTIMGVITIFYDISLSGDISIKTISGGLYQKMVASGTGLFIGVIAFLFYHMIDSMINSLAKKIERSSLEFLDTINEPGK